MREPGLKQRGIDRCEQPEFQRSAKIKPAHGGAGRTAHRESASGDVHGHFETEAQVSSSGLGPHG